MRSLSGPRILALKHSRLTWMGQSLKHLEASMPVDVVLTTSVTALEAKAQMGTRLSWGHQNGIRYFKSPALFCFTCLFI